jgi:ribonuclease HII
MFLHDSCGGQPLSRGASLRSTRRSWAPITFGRDGRFSLPEPGARWQHGVACRCWYGRFDYDRAHGRLVAGCDEVGRACFAGPLVAAAVLFDYDRLDQDLLAGLNDSKKLTPARREALYVRVLGCAARVAVVLRASRSIDVHGLQRMNLDALHRSLVRVAEPGCVLIADGDGFRLPPVGAVEPLNLVRGDSISAAVAAASIVAKVTRDRLMSRAAERWPGYGFERHKGYGTRQHREAIVRLGPCPLHRRSCRGVVEARAASAEPSAAPATQARPAPGR